MYRLRFARPAPSRAALLLLLHSDPVRSAPIVGSAASGARLLILCEQNGWCHVRTRTACGWVSKTDIVLFYCRPAL